MKGIEIKQKIERFPILKLHFKGIFAIDTIPRLNITNFVIVNTSHSGTKGLHWIVVYLSPFRILEVFDSSGIHFEVISSALKRHNPYNIIHNILPYQKLGTKNCGIFCIYFILNRILNLEVNFYDLLDKIFSSNLELNDGKIKDFKKWLG